MATLREVLSPDQRYTTKEEKPLWAPFAFPSSMRIHMMPTLKSHTTSLPLVLQETLET